MKENENHHGCEAAVVQCIDYRLRNHIDNWLEENFKNDNKEYDLISIAGSTKDLDYVKNQVDTSERLHHIKRLVLIHHEDCGAYGAESSPERHAQDLSKAREEISKDHPDLQIDLFYLKLNGEFNEII